LNTLPAHHLLNIEALRAIPGAELLTEKDLEGFETHMLREIDLTIRVRRFANENTHRFRINRPMSRKEPTATWRRGRGMYMSDADLYGE
jgi:hypothetical protein